MLSKLILARGRNVKEPDVIPLAKTFGNEVFIRDQAFMNEAAKRRDFAYAKRAATGRKESGPHGAGDQTL